jgi:hypothetical protein
MRLDIQEKMATDHESKVFVDNANDAKVHW